MSADYENNSPAQLLVASNGPRKGVRIQASYIKREFVDDDLIGRGPAGILYFNDIQDFNTKTANDSPVRHNYKITETKKDGHYTAIVEFTNSVKGPNAPYARFEGPDPGRILASNNLNGYEYHGEWLKFDFVGMSAIASKKAGEQNIVLIFGKTQVTLVDSRNDLKDASFEIAGEFYYADNITLIRSRRVFYTKGAIIFYEANGVDPNHTAYFIPSEKDLPGPPALFEDVQWGPAPTLLGL